MVHAGCASIACFVAPERARRIKGWNMSKPNKNLELLLCLIVVSAALFGGALAAFAQPVRIAIGAASVAHTPGLVAQEAGEFARGSWRRACPGRILSSWRA